MENTCLIWANQYTFKEGTKFRILKSYIDTTFNSKYVFVEALTGENKGVSLHCSIENFKRRKESHSIDFFRLCLNDYILAGWDLQRILKAGLCPKKYKSDLSQYLKYFNELN
jgi:hypothetical protein